MYEALTGRLPFDGNLVDILVKKQSVEPPPPREISLEIPEDLSKLCQDLLRVRPESRPTGGEVIRRLEGELKIVYWTTLLDPPEPAARKRRRAAVVAG